MFPNEFLELENVAACDENGDDILEVFTSYDPSFTQDIGETDSLDNCKLYCASTKDCWGCRKESNTLNVTTGYMAVIDCEDMADPKDVVVKKSFKKPGREYSYQLLHLKMKLLA